MNPTDVFSWGVLCCNCLLFLFLGSILMLWMLSPRVEGSYVERPQRTRADHRRRPAPRPAVERDRQPRPARTTLELDTSALDTTLTEAQRAAEAIDDLQVTLPTIQGVELEVKLPDTLEIVTSEAPWAQVAETVQVTVGEESYEGLEAIAEAGARAAVQQVAERVEQAVPAAKPVTQRVEEAARQVPSPLSAPTLADGIEIILQDLVRREAEPLRQAIRVESTAEGGVRIVVGDHMYFSVSEMPDGRAKQLLQRAVRRWNELWQEQDRAADDKG